MREIQFRYRHKSRTSDFIAIDIVTLEELYRGEYMYGLRNQEHWELLSRDEFTGLKDKNGKEIYEGDVVFDEDGEYSKTCSIQWDEINARFFGIAIEDGDSYEMQEIDGEIISNIYENPELLG